ncbi:FixJ family two-component response regulator [Sphingobium sp. B11D3B]|uniref:response regulator transcription factor n=1 Tax=Sphingobium sp. B11D3B TaxID=2940575 RepID=UPI002227D710|nr:response regulator [Sphingobium sp. B11D3B]MCW2387181.1 FixJ family two-component response regulator [Sphingobium sp. B11D3B]
MTNTTPSCDFAGKQGLPVYVVDDDITMRDACSLLLASVGYQVAAYDCASCFLGAVVNPEGVLILDMRMPGMSGLRLLERLELPRPGLEVVFISGTAEVVDAVRIMKAGAHDMLVKPFRDQQIIDAVDGAYEKASGSRCDAVGLAAIREAFDRLSPAERDVAGYLAAGLLNKQIAGLTDRSENTVKVHRSRVMQKMSVSSVFDLATKLDQIGVLDTAPHS